MPKKDYRTLTDELDTVIEKLQNADIDIEEAVQSYEKGMVLIKQIETILKDAENKVIKVTATHSGKE